MSDSSSLSSSLFVTRFCHRAIFRRSFFARLLNLVTHTPIHFFHFSSATLVFHLAFMLSTCYSTNDSHESLWLNDYTFHFILIFHLHSFIRWNEDLIDFLETSDGYTLTNRFLERSLFSIITFLRQPFLARFSKVPTVRIRSTVLTQPGTPVSFQGMFICLLFDFRKLRNFPMFSISGKLRNSDVSDFRKLRTPTFSDIFILCNHSLFMSSPFTGDSVRSR